MEVVTTNLPTEKSYLGQALSAAKNYARHSYPLSYLYGRVRGLAQPWISTKFNVHQIYDGVYIGDIESASNIKELKILGITHIVTAILGVSPQFPKDFTYLNIPVMDVETEDITPYLQQASFFIDNAIGHGGKVLVHCMRGVSRSATIVAAWIITRNRGSVEDTLCMIREKRECINPNPAFRSQLAKFSEEVSVYTRLLNSLATITDDQNSTTPMSTFVTPISDQNNNHGPKDTYNLQSEEDNTGNPTEIKDDLYPLRQLAKTQEVFEPVLELSAKSEMVLDEKDHLVAEKTRVFGDEETYYDSPSIMSNGLDKTSSSV